MSTDNSASPETPSNEEGWGTDFDAFEQGASKIVALWELAPSGELAKPTPTAPETQPEDGKETWAAADPAVSTLPDPVPPETAKAEPASVDPSPPAAEAPAEAPAAKKALPAPSRSAKKTLIAGSLQAPPAPAAPAAPAVAAVQAAPAVAAPAVAAVATPVALPSIVVEPQPEAPRASVAPDTVIDAKPLDRPSRPLPSLAPPVEEPIPLPPRGSNAPLMMGAAAFVLLSAMVGGFLLFRATPTAAPATGPATAVAPPAVPTPPAPAPLLPNAAAAAPAPAIAEAPATAPVNGEAPATAPVDGTAPPVEATAALAVAPVVEAPAVVPPTPPMPPPPVTHALTVSVEPGTATVTVDGAPVTLPYEARFDEGTRHTVVASAEGYNEATRVVELDGDRRVSLRLERERGRRGGSSRIGSRIVRRGSGSSGSGSSGSGSSGSGSSRSGSSGSGSSGRSGSGTFVSESPY